MRLLKLTAACIATLCWLSLVPAAHGQTTIPLDSKATYLRTNEDPQALNAVPISLDALGIRPGDTITLRVLGRLSYCYECGWPEDTVWLAGGIFSSSRVLLPANRLNRVPGAHPIGQGSSPPCDSLNTYMGELPTDIPEDFGFSSFESATVKVPPGAHWIFFAVVDSYWGDNADPNSDLAVDIQKALVAIPLTILWRVVPWEPDRMTTPGGDELQYPSEGQIFYVAADSQEPGTRTLYRFVGADHRDSTLTELPGYSMEGPLGFPWASKSLPGLSPIVEGFNAETGDYALMQPGEQLPGYTTEGLNVFGYKRYYNEKESLVSIAKGGVTVQSNRVKGGSLWRWTWNGVQFLNNGYAGSGGGSVFAFDLGEGMRNMQEARDYFDHGVPVVRAQNHGATQITRAVPLEGDPRIHGGSLDNPVLWRDALLGKNLTLDFEGMGPVARYTTYVSLPTGTSTGPLYEPLVWLRSEFNRFWVYYADSDYLQEVTSSMPDACYGDWPLEVFLDFGGVIVSDNSGNLALGAYAVSIWNGGSMTEFQLRMAYCWGDGTSETALDHSRLDVIRLASVPAGESTFNSYLITDTVENVRQKMRELYLMGAK